MKNHKTIKKLQMIPNIFLNKNFYLKLMSLFEKVLIEFNF